MYNTVKIIIYSVNVFAFYCILFMFFPYYIITSFCVNSITIGKHVLTN